jgi:glycosyltransferase involved in cell wall biosynthesis
MITIVLPYYGPDTAGGAETQARSLARALHSIGVAVRVWCSTVRDSFHPDATTYYPPGHSELDGIPIWRFGPTPADERGIPRFFRQHPALLPPLDGFSIHELRLLGSLVGSDDLYAAVLAEREQSAFIFMPYPFPTTFWGALLAGERGFLLPCLHDEPYARYRTYAYLFAQAAGVLCNSAPEADLVRHLYTVREERLHVPGEGIDLAPRGDAAAFQRFLAATHPGTVGHPLLLYVGRRDQSKNIWQLLLFMREYCARRRAPLRMLLSGRDPLDMPHSLAPLVVDLGYLCEQEKHNAYAAADLFVQPSLYESFSIVLMEAWLQGTPALVHADCAVTSEHCARSGGGLAFGDFGTFAAALDLLLPRPDIRQTLGARGRAYVLETCNWQEVARRTARAVGV